ncbi:MAG: hypothetical protein FWE42_08585 [Defluviitaleaceae bacterium]|nr:hypothetical protein [Defluviitaleaceae bacterium]
MNLDNERLKHRDRAEKLLSCLEAIDDDLIAEAARAVNQHRPKKFTLLSWGSVAAVFVGVIAVACAVLLAFWVSGMGEGAAANGEYGSYNTEETNGENDLHNMEETPAPSRISFESGLPLPQIHETAHLTILPAGQYRMTVNNPWFTAGHITELPVFLPHATSRMEGSPGNWRNIIDNNLPDADHEEYLLRAQLTAKLVMMALGIPVDNLNAERDGQIVRVWPYGLDRFMCMDMITPAMSFTFPEDAVVLPPGASISEAAETAENQAAIDYLAGLFSTVFPMDVPTLTQGEILLDIGGPRMYSRQRFFDAGGSPYFNGDDPVASILNFNFNWVEVLSFQPDTVQWMSVSTFPQAQFESLQLGNFPIITSGEAAQMLIDGYFISEMPDSQWPGEVAAWGADAELVYHNNGTVIMPMYRFLVPVDMPLWHEGEPGEWAAFARYYVPAVRRDYLEPMTRRPTQEVIAAPTGPRALPERVFRHAHANEWWRPIAVPRYIVEELWQEVLEDIGGLEQNQAYQFRTACGLYAMITGSRTLTSREELQRYYPALDMPERVGDFALQEVFVYDQSDRMFIYNQPMETLGAILWQATNALPAPVGEIFIRPLDLSGHPIAFSISAMYENSEGVQVGLSVPSAWFDLPAMIDGEFSTLDMGDYGQLYFQGQPGAYYRALFGPEDYELGFYVELWFPNSPVGNRRSVWDLRLLPGSIGIDSNLILHGTELFTPVPREDLEELVRLFNPSGLAEAYRWSLMSWQ